MKKIFTTLLFQSLFSVIIVAQNCGTGPNSVAPIASTVAGFSPSDTSQPCAMIGSPVSDTIYFHDFDSVKISPGSGTGSPIYSINSLTIDSIYLPAGLCWTTNSSTNQFGPGANGAILISGTPTGPPGQYKLRIIVTIVASHGTLSLILSDKNMETLFDVRYDLRVICPSSSCPSVNTTDTTDSYIAYAACSGGLSASITPSGSASFCPGDSLQLTANSGSGYTYLWSTGATSQSIWVSSAASYTVTVYDSPDSAVSSPTVVSASSLPDTVLTLSGSTSLCSGDSVTISAASGLTYHWNNGASTSSITVSANSTYDVTVTNAALCSAVSYPVTVTVHPLPDTAVSLSGPTSFCQGDSLILSAVSGLSYHWSTSATTSSITVKTTGSYTVTVTNATPCSAVSNAVSVTVQSLPDTVLTLSGPTTFCMGDSVTISAIPGLSYLWSDSARTSSITVSASGVYSVTVTNAFPCSAASGDITVTATSPPVATITLSTPDTLSSTPAATYQWYRNDSILPGDTMQQLIATVDGVYKVILDATGCQATSNQINVSLPGGINTIYPVSSLRLYPNPGDGILTLEAPAYIGCSYEIDDQLGRLVRMGDISATLTMIDVSAETGGIYYLTIRSAEKYETLRFVVMK